MAKWMKIVFIIFTVALAAIVLVICQRRNLTNEEFDANDVVRVKYRQMHMDKTQCFSFSIYKESGEAFADASYETDESEWAEFNHHTVSVEKFDEIIQLIEKYDLISFMKHFEEKPACIPDQTTWKVEVEFENGTILTADSAGIAGAELELFFRSLF